MIIELKTELRCLDAAIASMEELARVQNIPDPALPRVAVPDSETSDGALPVKRGPGRPKKVALPPTPSPNPGASTSGDAP